MSLEDRVVRLETLMQSMLASKPAAPSGGDTLDAKYLRESWADKTIKRDPPKWKGRSFVGSLFSRATPEWLEDNASFLDWKAAKGRAETPVRTDNKGKPWHERDTFDAKLCRTWAQEIRAGRIEQGPSPLPVGTNGDAYEEPGDADVDF